MIRRVSACLSVAALLLAGCGSANNSTKSLSTNPPGTAGTAASTQSAPPPSTTTPPTPPASLPANVRAEVQVAVAACKQSVQAAPTLSATTKAKLNGICDKAATGDTNSVAAAAREVCVEVVNSSPLPNGPDKQRAIASCKTGK